MNAPEPSRPVIPIVSVPAEPASENPAADDSSQVVSLYASDAKIYARSVAGLFNRWRWAMVWITQIVFYGLPWLNWNERQAVLFDLAARRFYIFGWVLYPQDFIYLTGLLVISALSLFLFTAVAGRLWCGYACPQTVYTEIFMWVEHHIEGDRMARMKLDQSAWSLNKLARKSAKHAVWIAIGLWTGFTFVGYFTPVQQLLPLAEHLRLGPWEAFWILFYGFATYGNAGWMREQVCKYMCPYARFQSAMFDRDTLIVSYDATRGEQRGSRSRKTSPADNRAKGLGDCVDCTLCVQVCPTGIDIRNGLQYECIGCAACIDVCDSVMDKMNYPRGLISYSTQRHSAESSAKLSLAGLLRRAARPRVLLYSALLATLSTGLLLSLLLRTPLKVDVVRDRGSLARVLGTGEVENVYRLQIMNATEQAQTYWLSVNGLPGLRLATGASVQVDAAASRWIVLRVQLPEDNGVASGSHPIHFQINGSDKVSVSEKSVFLVPRQ